jgi:hypothetical protein
MEGLAAIKESRNKQTETHNENVILILRLKLAERTNELQSVIQTTEKAGRRQQELEKYYEYRPNNQGF